MTHHENMRQTVLGYWVPIRPQVLLSRYEQWKRRRECRREFGHCWHPADPMIAWFCCLCGSDLDGLPPQHCVFCLAEEKAAS